MVKCIYILLFCFILYSCKKEGNAVQSNDLQPGPNIYACGYDTYYYNIPGNPFLQNKIRAVYWKNNEIHPLNESQEIVPSLANSIAVFQDHIYIAGEYNGRPCYWVDDQKYFLITDAAWEGSAKSAVINNGILYIAGVARPTSVGPFSAFLWIVKSPSEIQQIQLSGPSGYVNKLVMEQNIAYVAGKESNIPCYWTYDGMAVNFFTLGDVNNNTGEIYSLKLFNNIVFGCGYLEFAGGGNYYVGYWKNTQFFSTTMFPADATFKDLAFAPNGVMYFAGRKEINNISKAAIWKVSESEPMILSDQESGLSCIFFDNTDCYVAGSVNYRAAYWKNGVGPKFFNSSTNSTVHQICIVHD